jgi:hypothetical protein
VPPGDSTPPVTPIEPDADAPAARAALVAFDPAARGPYATARNDYARAPFKVADMAVPLEVVGEVVSPVGATGKRPLVLFLHGRHTSCYSPTDPELLLLEWPCPAGSLPIPSYQGYRSTAEILASQGFTTVSISANAINAQDGWLDDAGMKARSALVRHHLDQLYLWSQGGRDPIAAVLRNQVDWNRVVLVGHSRGGEGVERAAIDALAARTPYRIAGLSLIGPTNFQRRVAPGIHTSVIHPYCDGDVSDLQGQLYVDNARDLLAPGSDPALYSAAMVLGANHNFFNREWTPGEAVAPAWDDWFGERGSCGSRSATRLTPSEQRAVGAVYIAALARLAGFDDQAAVPFLDGSNVRAASAGRADVRVHAVGGNEQVLYRAGDPVRIGATAATTSNCVGYQVAVGRVGLSGVCTGGSFEGRFPHWLTMYGAETAPPPQALRVRWDAGGSIRIPLPPATDLRGSDRIDVRFATGGLNGTTRPLLQLKLADGTTAQFGAEQRNLLRLPGRPDGSEWVIPKVWAQTLRFDVSSLPPAKRVGVMQAALVFVGGAGNGFLLDIAARATTTAPPDWRIDLPRVDVVSRSVREGSRPRVEQLEIRLSRPAPAPVRLWVQTTSASTGSVDGREVLVPKGARSTNVAIAVNGDREFSTWQQITSVVVRALDSATVGDSGGLLSVIEDDPAPKVTISPATTVVTEGDVVTWTITMSRPIADSVVFYGAFTPPTAGPELSGADVTEQQRIDWNIDWRDPALPLSPETFVYVELAPGATTAQITMATATDALVEGSEYARLELSSTLVPYESPTTVLTVEVRDRV